MIYKITNLNSKEVIKGLKIGQEVLFSGIFYMMRDQAHKRILEQIKKQQKLPFDLNGQIIYYCGPTKTPGRKVIGSCGPTTSSRMDKFTPLLLKRGIKGMIGKGARSKEVINAIRKNKAVYFLAPSGCGALLAQKVKKAKVIAYSDLGPEAVRRCEVVDFPLIVGIDSKGRDIYGKK